MKASCVFSQPFGTRRLRKAASLAVKIKTLILCFVGLCMLSFLKGGEITSKSD